MSPVSEAQRQQRADWQVVLLGKIEDSLSGVLGWQQQVTWSLLEMPVLRPQPRPGGSETPEMGPHSRVSASPPGDAGARRSKGGPCSEPGEQGSS